ncbi:hypothetical protein GGX14DRAFT_589169 [Mycena pura]|uniref:Uncharacterized protein n=1 Tax=Mycena pura TaxID=153505 RepID=A0AAD6Y431_9AGAR|nr:hypothetical protein GGX14DRAFT_589169 [Mycena pura]
MAGNGLADKALSAFESARGAYWAGHPGPYILEGTWSLATFEALATTLESKWRLGFYQGQIMLYGNPIDVHKVTHLFSEEVEFGVSWDSHPETPDVLKGFRSLRYLLAKKRGFTRKWMLTTTTSSSSMYCKEADGLFVAPTATREENGLAIEVAHSKSFPELCREVINWTTGDGNRVLLAVGLKWDPQLRLVVRDCTPSSTSVNCKVYNFGNGSNVARRQTPRTGPPTPVRVASHQLAEGCIKQNVVPTNPQTDELILELPIGAAFFYNLERDAFTKRFGLVLADGYLQDLKAKKWILDLGYIRNRICEIIAEDATIKSRTTQESGEEEKEEE